MPAANDLNTRIALAKGWEFRAAARAYVSPDGRLYTDELPDSVGTVEGLAGLMRELNERAVKAGHLWNWHWNPWQDQYRIRLIEIATGRLVHRGFDSPDDRPGDCIGEAYMSVFGEGAANDSTK